MIRGRQIFHLCSIWKHYISVQQYLVKVDEIQNRIKVDLKSEENRSRDRDRLKTDTIKRIGKEINKSVKKIINDIGFTVSNRDEGTGSTDSSFGKIVLECQT